MLEVQKQEKTVHSFARGLSLHEHICFLYDSNKKAWQPIADYLLHSPQIRHKQLYIGAPDCSTEVLSDLSAQGLDVASLTQTHALMIWEETGLGNNGRIESDTFVKKLADAAHSAHQEGYDGLQVVIEMTGAVHANAALDSILSFERTLEALAHAAPIAILCAYSRAIVDPSSLIRIIEAHPRIMSDGAPFANPRFDHKDGHAGPFTSEEMLRDLLSDFQEIEHLRQLVAASFRDVTRYKQTEAELKDSRQRYQRITEAITDYIFTVRIENGKPVETVHGPNCVAVTGYSSEEFQANPFLWIQMVPQEDVETVRKHADDVVTGRTDAPIEHRIIRKEGVVRWVRNTPVLHRNAEGRIIAYDGLIHDITERKAAEEAQRESRELLTVFLDQVPINAFMKDADGRLIYANPRSIEHLGADNWQNKNADQYYPSEIARTVNEADQEAMNSGSASHEEWLPDAKGNIKCFHTKKFRIERRNKSPLLGGISIDITDRKRMEEALRESEERFRRLTENIPGTVYLCLNDEPWTTLYLNDHIEQLTGYKPIEFIENKIQYASLCHPDDLPGMKTEISEALAEKRSFHLIYRIKNRSGDWRWVEERGVGIHRDNESVLLEGFISDITERRQMEEELIQAKRLESVGMLAGGIAHDFNNLLMAIMGNVSLAKVYTRSEDEMKRLLSNAETACMQARDLTQQLLTFAKGGAPVRKQMSLVQIVRETTRLALVNTETKVTLRFPKNIRDVNADAGQITQVVNHIVLNAVQAMSNGGNLQIAAENMTIRAKSALPLKPGTYVKISFCDEGVGIPKEALSHVFDPYFTTKQKSAGLGLAIAYSIIKNHDGLIAAASESGKGTTVSFYLPAADMRKRSARASSAQNGAVHGRILVMDDDHMVRTATMNVLRHLGYDAEPAADGSEAVALYEKAMNDDVPYDAVIIDLIVPGGMNGKETAEHLHKLDPHARMIVCSGYSNDPIMANYRAYGFTGVLTKPFSIRELEEVLQEVLGAE